jgi:hypothetical protein
MPDRNPTETKFNKNKKIHLSYNSGRGKFMPPPPPRGEEDLCCGILLSQLSVNTLRLRVCSHPPHPVCGSLSAT